MILSETELINPLKLLLPSINPLRTVSKEDLNSKNSLSEVTSLIVVSSSESLFSVDFKLASSASEMIDFNPAIILTEASIFSARLSIL